MNTIKPLLLVSSLAFLLIGCGDSGSGEKAEVAPAKQELKAEANSETGQKQLAELGEELEETVKKIESAPEEISDEEKQKMMMEALANTQTMTNAFAMEKERLPKIFELLKATRECLGDANSKAEAEACQEKIALKAKALGLDEEEFEEEQADFTWSKTDKEETLKDMDEAIVSMEKSLPCIEKAQNMMEMAACMGEPSSY